MKQQTLKARVLAAVLETGECTVSQVLAKVGRWVSESQAMARARTRARLWMKINTRRAGGRPASVRPNPSTGRRDAVAHALRELVRQGKLRRVATGVYAPPAPKIYREGVA